MCVDVDGGCPGEREKLCVCGGGGEVSKRCIRERNERGERGEGRKVTEGWRLKYEGG